MKRDKLLLSTLLALSIVLILMLVNIFIHELIRYQNLQLNIHILEDCKVDYNEINEVKF